MPFLALTKMWTLGGIILTLNMLTYSWLGCAFFIGRAVENGWIRESITVSKAIAIACLMIIGEIFITQFVFVDGDDGVRQIRASIAVIIGVIVTGSGLVFTIPGDQAEGHQIAPAMRKVLGVALIMVSVCVIYAAYTWFKTVSD